MEFKKAQNLCPPRPKKKTLKIIPPPKGIMKIFPPSFFLPFFPKPAIFSPPPRKIRVANGEFLRGSEN